MEGGIFIFCDLLALRFSSAIAENCLNYRPFQHRWVWVRCMLACNVALYLTALVWSCGLMLNSPNAITPRSFLALPFVPLFFLLGTRPEGQLAITLGILMGATMNYVYQLTRSGPRPGAQIESSEKHSIRSGEISSWVVYWFLLAPFAAWFVFVGVPSIGK